MFCSNCGKEINDKAVVCIHCGCAVNNNIQIDDKKDKSGLITLLLCLFLGNLGIHNFYVGRTGPAVTQLLCFTIGWFLFVPPFISMIWVFVELILIICGEFKDAKGNKLKL